MAKVFLDTNILFDVLQRNPRQEILHSLLENSLYVSPLSFHIYCYIYKIKIPNTDVSDQMEQFQLVGLSQTIVERALEGPTGDLEDNIQLHSAAEAGCDIFLTQDKQLFNLTFFGTMRLARTLNES